MNDTEIFHILTVLGIYLCIFIICGIIFFLLIKLLKPEKADIKKQFTNQVNKIYQNNGKMINYKIKLSKLGVMYRLNDYNLNIAKYIAIRLIIGIMGAMLLYLLIYKVYVIPIGLVLGYIAVPIYFKYQNKKDNEDMILDLYNTYASLRIQLNAGVYLGDTFESIYSVVINKRYKKALEELISNFADKTISSEDAIMLFKNRFDSTEIDKLCNLLNNCVRYGISDNYTKDIMSEIQFIMEASTLKAEHDIENKTGFITFGYFVVIIIIIAYTLFLQFGDAKFFFTY